MFILCSVTTVVLNLGSAAYPKNMIVVSHYIACYGPQWKLPGSGRLKRLRTTALEGAGFIPFSDTRCNMKSSLVYQLQVHNMLCSSRMTSL